MCIRAIALHEAIWEKRLEELSNPPFNQLFSTSSLAHCQVCKTTFIVLLSRDLDAQNPAYVAELEKTISGDCREGVHCILEIALDREPPASARSAAAVMSNAPADSLTTSPQTQETKSSNRQAKSS
jgi:hypothetical protein